MGQKKPINLQSCETIKIPDDFFDEEYGKMIQIKLVSEEGEKGEEGGKSIVGLKVNKNGINNCCFCCDTIGKTYHLLFNQKKNLKEKIEISIPENEFHYDKYDTNGTKYRKRFILANFHFPYIKINGVGIKLSELTKDIVKNVTSYQLSVYNYKKKQIVTKALEIPKPAIGLEKIYNDNYEIFNEYRDFHNSLVDEQSFNDNFNKLFEKYKNVKFLDYFLNISKAKIEKELNKTEYIFL